MIVSQVRVALRKESVDRNKILTKEFHRAPVALRKESVDRNAGSKEPAQSQNGRSPQGERG